MKATVQVSDLLKVITPMLKVINPRPTLPVLSAVLLTVRNGKMEITASNLDTTLKTAVDAEISAEGSVAMEAKILGELLKTLPDEPIVFELKDGTVTVKWASGKTKLPEMGADDYPALPDVEGETVEAEAAALADAMAVVTPCVKIDELRPVMSAVLLDVKDGKMKLVGSDSHQLAVAEIDVTPDTPEMKVLVPILSVPALRTLAEATDGKMKIQTAEKYAQFDGGGTTLICRLTEGKYPAYESVFPKDFVTFATLAKDSFVSMLRRVGVCAAKEKPVIRLKVTPGRIEAAAQDMCFNLSSDEMLESKGVEGSELTIGLRNDMFTSLLSRMPGSDVKISIQAPERAILIEPADGNGIRAILMPQRLE